MQEVAEPKIMQKNEINIQNKAQLMYSSRVKVIKHTVSELRA